MTHLTAADAEAVRCGELSVMLQGQDPDVIETWGDAYPMLEEECVERAGVSVPRGMFYHIRGPSKACFYTRSQTSERCYRRQPPTLTPLPNVPSQRVRAASNVWPNSMCFPNFAYKPIVNAQPAVFTRPVRRATSLIDHGFSKNEKHS